MEQFIGENKIIVVTEVDTKTPGGESMVEVSFENGTKEVMPKRRLETVVFTAEKGIPLQDKRQLNDYMANAILTIMAEYGVKIEEVDPILDSVGRRVEKLFDTTYTAKFGINQKEITTGELVKIEAENFQKENGNKTS